MPISFQRPSPLDISQKNPNKTVYYFGDANTDGSLRIVYVGSEKTLRMEVRISGVFVDTGYRFERFIAGGFVNNNSTANESIVNNIFTDMVFGTVGAALAELSMTTKIELLDEVNGTFRYNGLNSVDAMINLDFTVLSSGGTLDFRLKCQKSTDGGSSFVDLTDNLELLVAVGRQAQSIARVFPLSLAPGDQIKPQITRNSGNSGIITTYASIIIVSE